MSTPMTATAAAPSPLAELPLFASLTPDERADIAPLLEARSYARDEVIFFEGEPPRWLYIVTAGHVKLIKHSDDGRDIILHLAMPGDVIGGVSAFGRRPHPFTAQAMVPARALRVAGSDFAAIMEDHPPVASQLVGDLVERLTEAHETMKSLAVERVERRIARQLLKLSGRVGERTDNGLRITIQLARQDVADIAGTTVETAIRVLSRWRKADLVHTIEGHLVVADMEGLRTVAEEGVA